MIQSQIVRVVLVLLTIWCASSSTIVLKTGSKGPLKEIQSTGINHDTHEGDTYETENGIEVDIRNLESIGLTFQTEFLKLMDIIKRQNANIHKLREEIDVKDKEIVDLKLNLTSCERVNDTKHVKINGLYEQMMKDIKSKEWCISIRLMKRDLNQSTDAYKQLVNITKYYINYDFPEKAAQRGFTELIQVMLDNGLPINERYGQGKYTMLFSASLDGHDKVVKVLIQQGADLNLKTSDGRTPLHIAARKNYENIVQLLVESGADINAKDNIGDTPLHWAARNGNQSVVQYLVNKGCDTTITNKYSRTAADVAKTPK